MKKLLAVFLVLLSVNIYAEESKLSSDEIDGILLMREEEKLARDVYNKLYEIWNVNVFRNIARSEQTHMDRVKTLLDEFNIEDPAQEDIPGVFKNEELQHVYDDFIAKGSQSIYEALIIGSTIEDLDIYDLEHLLSETDNTVIIPVYTALRDASINHINSFERQLVKYGDGYSAQFITEEYLQQILK